MSVITVTLLVEDHLGTKVIALNRYSYQDLTEAGKIDIIILCNHHTLFFSQGLEKTFRVLHIMPDEFSVQFLFAPFCRMLTIKNPVRDDLASQWLRNKSQTELWVLVQHGNPQEIIPYSIALTSQLNQVLY